MSILLYYIIKINIFKEKNIFGLTFLVLCGFLMLKFNNDLAPGGTQCFANVDADPLGSANGEGRF